MPILPRPLNQPDKFYFVTLYMPADAAPLELLCPHCGYDVRGTAEARCSECGNTFDREALAISGVPWAHRRDVGRVRAFVRTVRMFWGFRAPVRMEISRPQDLADARRFARILSILIALPALAGWLLIAQQKGVANLVVAPTRGFAIMPGWVQDIGVPWSAGVMTPMVMLIGLVCATFQLTAAIPLLVGRGRSTSRDRQAHAVAAYTSAPLLWLSLAMLFGIAHYFAIATYESWQQSSSFRNSDRDWAALVLLGMGFALVAMIIACVAFSCVRAFQCVRVVSDSLTRALWSIPLLLVVWSLAIFTWIGLFPLAVGFTRIVLETLI